MRPRSHLPPPEVDEETDRVATRVVDAAVAVRRALGAGLLERPYRLCLAHDLRTRGHAVMEEVPLAVAYEGLRLENAYRLDLLVDDRVVVEVKAVDELHPSHAAQVLTYLRLSGHRLGLLINFNAVPFAGGIRRFVR